jgi:hypothetical protein
MNAESVEVAGNEWGKVLHHERWQTVELRWLPTTRDMSDEGFKESLELLAGAGERLRPQFMLIDATEFHHDFGEGVMAWRDEHIIPRYGSAGVTKFAFLVPEGAPGTVELGGVPAVEGPATFPTGWFSTRERAYRWLAE